MLTAACDKGDGLADVVSVANDNPDIAAGGFQWVQSKHLETREQFRRNFGLGYSYDAVRGEYCNWRDIRCQVLNRYYLENMQSAAGEIYLAESLGNSISLSSHYEYSLRDYVANVNVATKEEIDIGLYNGEKRKRQHFIEDGVQETIIYTLDEKDILVDTYVGYANLLARYKKQPDVLTESFRNAVLHLNATDDDNIAAVDSFINVWGTHVIVGAALGGRLCIDLMNYSWRYNDKSKSEEWETEEFLRMVDSKNEHRTGEDEFRWIEDSRLNLTVWGGDQSALTGILGEHYPDGRREFSTEGISKWRNSLYYDPDDPLASNVELVDMRVVPIWEFAEAVDHWQALRIKAAVTQDVSLQQQLLGNINFFDAAFPVRYESAVGSYRDEPGTWRTFTRKDSPELPQVVNIVSGGRYVASICHENIGGKDLWVCYPIYEGRINLACGVGVAADQTTYKVKWIGGKAQLTPQTDVAGGNFYITSGAVGVKAYETAKYADGIALPYIELCGGVQPDGSYKSSAYNVCKQDTTFFINAEKGLKGFVGFTEKDGVYVRGYNYNYIYNPNELKYE